MWLTLWLAPVAALAGITAAVVGVMLKLALWFALHTLFGTTRDVAVGPFRLIAPVWSSVDLGSLISSGLAIIAAFRWRAGMFTVLSGGALLGVLINAA